MPVNLGVHPRAIKHIQFTYLHVLGRCWKVWSSTMTVMWTNRGPWSCEAVTLCAAPPVPGEQIYLVAVVSWFFCAAIYVSPHRPQNIYIYVFSLLKMYMCFALCLTDCIWGILLPEVTLSVLFIITSHYQNVEFMSISTFVSCYNSKSDFSN